LKTTHNERPKRWAKRRGIALLMVLATVAVTSTVVIEFAHDTQVRARLAANTRDATRAYFLAKSGVELTRLLIGFMKQSPCPLRSGMVPAPAPGSKAPGGSTCEQELRALQAALNMAPTPFWQMLPINSSLFSGLADGSLASMVGIQAPPLLTGAQTADSEDLEDGSGGEGQVLFSNLGGSFEVSVDDEDRKVPLKNLWKGTPTQNRAAALRLMAMIASPRYDGLFSGTNSRGEVVDRKEFLSALVDWIDPDTTVSELDPQTGRRLTGTQDEDSRYDSDEAPYRSKNALFDSIAELRQVKGWTDEAYRAFADHVTVYGEDKINVESMLSSLMGSSPIPESGEEPIGAPTQFLTATGLCLHPDQLAQVWWRLDLWYQAFTTCMAVSLMVEQDPGLRALCPLETIPSLYPFDTFFVETLSQLAAVEGISMNKKACSDLVTSTSRYFRITSRAQVGKARRTLTLVLRYAPSDAQEERYYWREE
jgi:type II secretory pathway component PulK